MRLTPIIEDILRNNPKARDSDSELNIQVLLRMGVYLSDSQIDKLREINFESIRRTRQKLQQQGKYLPSERVARQRRLKSMIIQQNAPTAKPERVEYLINDQPEAIPWLADDNPMDFGDLK